MNKERKLAIEKRADQVKEQCQVGDYGFQDIFKSAEKIGYRVIRYPLGEDTFLGFALIKDSERIVLSNSSVILSREIFSIAHEIGHQVLHLSEHGLTSIKDDDFSEKDENEVEANYFAVCLLMPLEKVEKFIRFELNDKRIDNWTGFDIARLQTTFNVSFDMVLNRLEALGILNNTLKDKFKLEKAVSRWLKAINGNIELCKPTYAKRVPAEYLEWVISNYNEKLIPLKSLEIALGYVELKVDDLENLKEQASKDEESITDLLRRMD